MGNYISSLRDRLEGEAEPGGRESSVTTTTAASSNMQPAATSSRTTNLINQLIARTTGNSRKPNGIGGTANVTFSAYFFMAGQRFKNVVSQAQTFLFGEQIDLAFLLKHKPVAVSLLVSS